MKIILVGERENGPPVRPAGWPKVSPDRYWRWALRRGAFHNRSSREKLSSVGIDLGTASSVNLLPPDLQLARWDPPLARRIASGWTRMLCRYDRVLFVGSRVAMAFGITGPYSRVFGDLLEVSGLPAVIVPHPSGLCRWWNDPGNPRRLRRRLARCLP